MRVSVKILILFTMIACVDRININIDPNTPFALVISGYITDQPGPYTILVQRGYDIESLGNRTPISIQSVVMSDDHGVSEELSEIRNGVYSTDSAGIRGIVGRAYKLRVELKTGRVYESVPDTLKAGGNVDSVYVHYTTDKDFSGGPDRYALDVLFNSSTESIESDYYYLWRFVGTYQVKTQPQFHRVQCAGVADDCPTPVNCGCPSPLPCSGYVFGKTIYDLVYVKPSTCSICWVNIFNSTPLVSDDKIADHGQFNAVNAAHIIVTQYMVMFKMHLEIQQMRVSRNAFLFWKAIKDQKLAIGSLFQPVTGKIPTNFVQVAGPSGMVEGTFFAAGINSKAIYVRPLDIPFLVLIPQDVSYPYPNKISQGSCLDFPYSTTKKPLFWKD